MNASDIKIINRLISNFSYDKRWLYRFRKAENEKCDNCNVVETAEHVIFICTKYSQSRMNYRWMSEMASVDDLWKSNRRDEAIREICRFVCENSIEF